MMKILFFAIFMSICFVHADLLKLQESLEKMEVDIAGWQYRMVVDENEQSYSLLEGYDGFSFLTPEGNIGLLQMEYEREKTLLKIQMCFADEKVNFILATEGNSIKLQEIIAGNTGDILECIDLYQKALSASLQQQNRESMVQIVRMMSQELSPTNRQREGISRGYKKIYIDWRITKETIIQLIKIKKGKYQVVSGYIETKKRSTNIASWRVMDQIIDGAFLKLEASVTFWGTNFWLEGTATILCKEVPSAKEERGGTYQAYAPPMFWGTWTTVAFHLGETTYQITYTPLGDTMVYGEVRYYYGGTLQQVRFYEGVTIRVQDAANVQVRFYGVPLGSMLKVYVR